MFGRATTPAVSVPRHGYVTGNVEIGYVTDIEGNVRSLERLAISPYPERCLVCTITARVF